MCGIADGVGRKGTLPKCPVIFPHSPILRRAYEMPFESMSKTCLTKAPPPPTIEAVRPSGAVRALHRDVCFTRGTDKDLLNKEKPEIRSTVKLAHS